MVIDLKSQKIHNRFFWVTDLLIAALLMLFTGKAIIHMGGLSWMRVHESWKDTSNKKAWKDEEVKEIKIRDL